MLFEARVSDNLNGGDDRIIPIAASDKTSAAAASMAIMPNPLYWSIESITRVDGLDWHLFDLMLERVHAWWREYCEYADNNASVSDDMFEDCVRRMHDAFDAVYDLTPE